MSLRAKLMLPREHGAWAMFYVPMVLGLAVSGTINWGVLLLLLGATALFISREPLLVWWRAKNRGREARAAGKLLLIYLSLSAIFGLPLILLYRRFWLVALGLIGLTLLVLNGRQGARLEERTVSSELMAIAGMTLTAPAAYYVAGGLWDNKIFLLWALSAFYFASSVFYIKLRVIDLNPKRQNQRRRIWQNCAIYHSFMLAALIVLMISSNLHLFILIAFAPALFRTLWSLFHAPGRIDLTRAGILEIVYSLIFLIFTTLSLRIT